MKFNEVAYKEIIDCALKLAHEKYRGYGSDNIKMFGDFGCLVRANDKLQRLKTIYLRRLENNIPENEAIKNAVSDEKIDDTILDAINYLVYMLMCRNEKWE